MMKKWFVFFLIFTFLVGCSQNDTNSNEQTNENDNEAISISIKEGTLTSKDATVVLKNESDEAVIFTSYFLIEKENNGKWEELPYVIDESVVGWEDIAYPVGGENEATMELVVQWEWLYGELEEGSYRLTKDYFLFDDYTKESVVSTQFTIK
jgi:hypothetical protein